MKIRITWEKIRVHKSDSYGLFGEPGSSAEWELRMTAEAPTATLTAQRDEATWMKKVVRDNRTYEVNQFVEVDLVAPHLGGVRIYFSGWETDSQMDDILPVIDESFRYQASWDAGQRYQRKGPWNKDFSYTVTFTIAVIDPRNAAIAPGHGTLNGAVDCTALWNASDAPLELAPGLTFDEVNAQASERWGRGGRFAQLQAYVDRAAGGVRYNVIWEYTGIGQAWNLSCDEAWFVQSTGEMWSWARPHSVVPFVVDGELRYAVLWNQGQHAQKWHHNVDEAGFRAITGETWSWARPHQVYGFTLGGQVRYSCLWNAGQHSVLWHPNCSQEEADKIGNDNWSWGRAHQIQAFATAAGRRYSVLWSGGQHGQIWNTRCSYDHVAATTVDLSDWARPFQVLSTVPLE